jgi:hypothetical protein
MHIQFGKLNFSFHHIITNSLLPIVFKINNAVRFASEVEIIKNNEVLNKIKTVFE